MRHSTSRVLTTHVGSLVRPLEVMEFMKAIEKGLVIDEQTFAGVLRSAVAEVVRRQAEIGIDVVSDGEYGKRGWSQYVTERLTGFERRECMPGERPTPVFAPLDRRRFAGFYEIYDRLEKCLWLPQTDWISRRGSCSPGYSELQSCSCRSPGRRGVHAGGSAVQC